MVSVKVPTACTQQNHQCLPELMSDRCNPHSLIKQQKTKTEMFKYIPPCQWNQVAVTLIYQWKNRGGRDGGKKMIQRLNEESGRQENAVLSTWR